MKGMQELWAFQEADLALIRHQSDIKASPVRKKLRSVRSILVEGQNTMHRIETESDENVKGVSSLDDNRIRLSESLKTLLGEAKAQDLDDVKAVQEAIKEAEVIQNEMTSVRKGYSAIINSGKKNEKTLTDLKKELSKAKKEYIELKASFEKENEEAEAEKKRLNSLIDKASAKVDKTLMRKYTVVRKNCIPAVAMVENSKCTGCNMSLPSLTMHNIKDSPEIFECENCGRILYMP